MSYNQYPGNPYGAPPPGYGGYGGVPPGMGAPPGGLGTVPTHPIDLTAYDGDDGMSSDTNTGYSSGPPPGMGSAAPGMAPPPGMGATPPGVQGFNAPSTSSRPSGIPASFQPPANMPNINFNAPVIRLGTGGPSGGGRGDGPSTSAGGRPGLGSDGRGEPSRDRLGRDREQPQVLIPPTTDEKLRSMVIYEIPESLSNEDDVRRLCNAIGRLLLWDTSTSLWPRHKDKKYGFALFDDEEAVSIALKLLKEESFEVPVKRQPGTAEPPKDDDDFDDIEKTRLQVSVDESIADHHESLAESQASDPDFQSRLEAARKALKQVQRELFYPPLSTRTDATNDTTMGNADGASNVEVVNISIAQEDELADIPAEMREVVAKEIAAFRERSNQRDIERLRREEEIAGRHQRSHDMTANTIPVGPRGGAMSNAPTGPKGQNGHDRAISFVNGAAGHHELSEDENTDASDGELERRRVRRREDEEQKKYLEMERKWTKRERIRQQALEREQEREKQEADLNKRRRDEQMAREKAWDDDVEASRKTHLYYRDRNEWERKRAIDRAIEEAADEADRREEAEEKRREQEQLDRARGQADSFLDQQDREMGERQAAAATAAAAAAAPAPAPFKLSLGAAAQRAQASRAVPQRRTIAEVENLLDDEDSEQVTKRPLIPLQMEPLSSGAGMTEEEISQAVRSLAQEIPTDKEGLWAWDVKWEYMDEGIIRDRLRPFVEKKIVEYLGVQEEMLVETVEEQIRKRGTAAGLVDELEGALDEEAEDLVKKLWRMVIFFTECEKRGLPA
ncbi:rbm25 protein [Purpureocillium lavendulum]|uniref:Rbm25 protein n=1 Tax=Purpureocillium lavendulum TaxID=1247861 RepID=A0AB34G087_9HYPO|nr:rbm25 protein [Purpureocillium lavendulum]